MKDLIEALTILLKYCDGDKYSPTHCEHDVLHVYVDLPVSDEDKTKLEELGFRSGDGFGGDDDTSFSSYRFGSC
jgi:hypothetical protein